MKIGDTLLVKTIEGKKHKGFINRNFYNGFTFEIIGIELFFKINPLLDKYKCISTVSYLKNFRIFKFKDIRIKYGKSLLIEKLKK